jgi:hypothetical protein
VVVTVDGKLPKRKICVSKAVTQSNCQLFLLTDQFYKHKKKHQKKTNKTINNLIYSIFRALIRCINSLNAELNPICHLLALLKARRILHVSRIMVKTYWRQNKNANLKFTCPCIASIYLKYNQQDATFSWSIYFYKLLCMFQAAPSPIIRSTKLYIQRQVLSNQYCRQQYWSDNTWRCMYSFVLLMMGEGTAWNM